MFFFSLSLKTCFDWFKKGQLDLEPDTQSQMFANKVLKLEPGRLTMKGAGKFRYSIVAFVYYFFTLTVTAVSKKTGLYTNISGCVLIPSDNSNNYFPLNSSPIIIIDELRNWCHQMLVVFL